MPSAERIPYYMITNVGTLCGSEMVRRYPYHLVLAQMFAASKEYREAVLELKKRGARIILDNGAHEGIDVELDFYMECVRAIGPHVVVLPDLIGRPGLDSRHLSMGFALVLDKAYVTQPEGHQAPIQFMFAPQGESKTDILDEYDWATTNLDPNRYCIGAGQSYLTWEDQYLRHEEARFRMLSEVRLLPNAARLHYHILGARWQPKDIRILVRMLGLSVIGLDSIKPCKCALEELTYPIRAANHGEFPFDRLSTVQAQDLRLFYSCLTFCKYYGLTYGGAYGVPTDSLPTHWIDLQQFGDHIHFIDDPDAGKKPDLTGGYIDPAPDTTL